MCTGPPALHVPSTSAWTSWQTVPVTLHHGGGHQPRRAAASSRPTRAAVNLDYVAVT